jgi:hypothetical protein
MRFLLIAIFATLGVLFCGTSAIADTRTLATQGAWKAYGGRSTDGTQVCGMSVSGDQGRSLHIKYYDGTNDLSLQAFKESWRIPVGTRFPVIMRVDGRSPWHVPQAYGRGDLVEWRVSLSQGDSFLSEFRFGTNLNIAFPSGSEAPWTASLSGSNAITSVFITCIQSMTGNNRPVASQPFGAVPTQPFSSPRN